VIAKEKRPCLTDGMAREMLERRVRKSIASPRLLLAAALPSAMVTVATVAGMSSRRLQHFLPCVPQSHDGFSIRTKPKPFLSRLPASR
jgi:hypothetical protein